MYLIASKEKCPYIIIIIIIIIINNLADKFSTVMKVMS